MTHTDFCVSYGKISFLGHDKTCLNGVVVVCLCDCLLEELWHFCSNGIATNRHLCASLIIDTLLHFRYWCCGGVVMCMALSPSVTIIGTLETFKAM